MHFRLRGNHVQVVKTVTDKKTLKSKSVPAGSANVRTGVLTDQLLESLSERELQEVRGWIENRQRITRLRNEVDAHLLASRVLDVAQWLKDAPPETAAVVTAECLDAMAHFRRTAVKHGIVKSAKRG